MPLFFPFRLRGSSQYSFEEVVYKTTMSTPSTNLEQLADQLFQIYEEDERRAILEARTKLHGWLGQVFGCDVEIGFLRDGSYCLQVKCRSSTFEAVRSMAPELVGEFPVRLENMGAV